MQYHGYVNEEGFAGPLFYSYLELLKDKLKDGYLDNDEFLSLKAYVKNAVHVTWDDHDYLTNDPSNPHYLRHGKVALLYMLGRILPCSIF
jgi:hypothetical protein